MLPGVQLCSDAYAVAEGADALILLTQYTAMVTPSAQPAVMTIHPELWPLVRCSTTLATTPSPSTIRIAVPNTSARIGDMAIG